MVTVLWWVLPGPCFGACGAAANSMRMALSTTFEPAKLEEGEESSRSAAASAGPRGWSSWTIGIAVRGASLSPFIVTCKVPMKGLIGARLKAGYAVRRKRWRARLEGVGVGVGG